MYLERNGQDALALHMQKSKTSYTSSSSPPHPNTPLHSFRLPARHTLLTQSSVQRRPIERARHIIKKRRRFVRSGAGISEVAVPSVYHLTLVYTVALALPIHVLWGLHFYDVYVNDASKSKQESRLSFSVCVYIATCMVIKDE